MKNNEFYKKKLLTFLDILKGLENWRLRVLSMERGESVTDLFRHIFVLSQSFLKQTIHKETKLQFDFIFFSQCQVKHYPLFISKQSYILYFHFLKNNIVFLFQLQSMSHETRNRPLF